MIGEGELGRRFDYHAPDAERVALHAAIRARFAEVARFVDEVCPDGREKSLAWTGLEEAMFWANAALARPAAEASRPPG